MSYGTTIKEQADWLAEKMEMTGDDIRERRAAIIEGILRVRIYTLIAKLDKLGMASLHSGDQTVRQIIWEDLNERA